MVEIERKFLVDSKIWQPKSKGTVLKQGYLSIGQSNVVRVRIADEKAYITIKGKTTGISRVEFEYEIQKTDALQLMKLCINRPVEKKRYTETFENMLWEIDVFEGENVGLVLAEIELVDESTEFILPKWLLKEVSADERYFNSYLSANPFSKW